MNIGMGVQTPTDARIRKVANGYLVELFRFNPQAATICARQTIEGHVFADVDALLAALRQYLIEGQSSLCDDSTPYPTPYPRGA